jgi:hypothetical protein
VLEFKEDFLTDQQLVGCAEYSCAPKGCQQMAAYQDAHHMIGQTQDRRVWWCYTCLLHRETKEHLKAII